MKKQKYTTFYHLLIIGSLLVFGNCTFNYAQELNKSFDVPGGGGSSNTTPTVESNDNTMLYVVGGAVIVGIVVYALMRDKKEKPVKDTTAAILEDEYLEKNLSYIERATNIQSQIPINISFGMQRDQTFKDERRYFVGLNYNF
jgi:hypothetical protein